MELIDALGLALCFGGIVVIVVLMRQDRPGKPKDGPW